MAAERHGAVAQGLDLVDACNLLYIQPVGGCMLEMGFAGPVEVAYAGTDGAREEPVAHYREATEVIAFEMRHLRVLTAFGIEGETEEGVCQ